jgi:predicted chitinase
MKIITRFKRCILTLLGIGVFTLAFSAGAQAVIYQAEDYNNYYDTTAGNSGGAYRSDDVDIEVTSDSGGGYNVGWIDTQEWLVYNSLNIPSSGSYTIRMRVASPNSDRSVSVDLNGGSIQLGTLGIPNTGGWQNWTTISHVVNINAGTYDLGVFATTDGWNFNWIEIVSNSSGGIVTLYQHCNYDGWSTSFDVGDFNLSAMQSAGAANDDASSIRVTSGYSVTLYQHDNYGGASITLSGDDSCLNNNESGGVNFNDQVSSLKVTSGSSGGSGISGIVSESMFNDMFPNRNSFYTYSGLVEAGKSYPEFADTGDLTTRKRETAAALANFSHETGGFVYITEIAKNDYCGDWDGDPNTCPCEPNKQYYGRGPIQLSWNGNYCAAGAALGLDLRKYPEMVEQNSTIAWQTSLWFWMTQQGAGYWPAHTSMVNDYGFGETIRTINGALECNGGEPEKVQARIDEYKRLINMLGTTPGDNLSC